MAGRLISIRMGSEGSFCQWLREDMTLKTQAELRIAHELHRCTFVAMWARFVAAVFSESTERRLRNP